MTIVVGSGHRAAEWALSLAAGEVDTGDWGDATMIVGGTFPDIDELRARCGTQGIRFARLNKEMAPLASSTVAKQMARTLASSTVALTTGGMIVYECVAMGVPTVVYPQEQNLVGECAWFESRGCVVSLGHEGGCILLPTSRRRSRACSTTTTSSIAFRLRGAQR